MFDAYHFHIGTTFDTTDSVVVKTFFITLTKKDTYSTELVVTLLQVFPNLFPCVYIPFNNIKYIIFDTALHQSEKSDAPRSRIIILHHRQYSIPSVTYLVEQSHSSVKGLQLLSVRIFVRLHLL